MCSCFWCSSKAKGLGRICAQVLSYVHALPSCSWARCWKRGKALLTVLCDVVRAVAAGRYGRRRRRRHGRPAGKPDFALSERAECHMEIWCSIFVRESSCVFRVLHDGLKPCHFLLVCGTKWLLCCGAQGGYGQVRPSKLSDLLGSIRAPCYSPCRQSSMLLERCALQCVAGFRVTCT